MKGDTTAICPRAILSMHRALRRAWTTDRLMGSLHVPVMLFTADCPARATTTAPAIATPGHHNAVCAARHPWNCEAAGNWKDALVLLSQPAQIARSFCQKPV